MIDQRRRRKIRTPKEKKCFRSVKAADRAATLDSPWPEPQGRGIKARRRLARSRGRVFVLLRRGRRRVAGIDLFSSLQLATSRQRPWGRGWPARVPSFLPGSLPLRHEAKSPSHAWLGLVLAWATTFLHIQRPPIRPGIATTPRSLSYLLLLIGGSFETFT